MQSAPAAVRRRLALFLVIFAAVGAMGCGGGGGPYPVTGTVIFDDNRQPAQELAGYTVTFDSPELHKSATGQIDAQGNFRLTTRQANDGAFPGRYKVVLTPPPPAQQDERRRTPVPGKPVPLDPRYLSIDQTDLEITVEAKSQEIALPVKRAPRS
jgi:hypothetical protein